MKSNQSNYYTELIDEGFKENFKLLEEFDALLKRKKSAMQSTISYSEKCRSKQVIFNQEVKDDLDIQVNIYSERISNLQKELSAASKKLLNSVQSAVA